MDRLKNITEGAGFLGGAQILPFIGEEPDVSKY